MKYVVVIGDGMADHPVEGLNGRTPLQAAEHPHMDFIASHGTCGMLRTLPEGVDTGTDVAVLSILGYNPKVCYTGRGPLEAASLNVKLNHDDIALRCNLITVENNKLMSHAAGHIKSEEAAVLIDALSQTLAVKGEVEFYAGVGYRHILVLRGAKFSTEIEAKPPHDCIGRETSEILIKPKFTEAEETAAFLNGMMLKSKDILENHPLNAERKHKGELLANMMWLWSPGKPPQLQTLREKYGITSAVISAVDVVKGIGVYAGMMCIKVPGATGYYDTNYEAKADYALKALEEVDMVLVHVEAPDEAGHVGDWRMKVKTIQDLDQRLIGRLLSNIKGDHTIAVLPDHPTPIDIRTHIREPVPFAIYINTMAGKSPAEHFDEAAARKTGLMLNEPRQFMPILLGR